MPIQMKSQEVLKRFLAFFVFENYLYICSKSFWP